jgi:hypothetical protein
MALLDGVPIYAMCRIQNTSRNPDHTLTYNIHVDFTGTIPIPGPEHFTSFDDVSVATDIEPTDSEISSFLRSQTAALLEAKYGLGWTEADIRGLSL